MVSYNKYVLQEGVWVRRGGCPKSLKFLLKAQEHLQEGVEIGFYSEAKILDERDREIWHFYGY
jgi:hypothetical protein